MSIPSNWVQRIDEAAQSPDNVFIPRVTDAGQIKGDVQIMHNGIEVIKDGYCGEWMTELIKQNRGCHEPQEERAFQDVLKHIPAGATMIELGSYWAFYSLWFSKAVEGAKCFLVDEDQRYLDRGLKNFEINGKTGTFEVGKIGPGRDQINMASFFERHNIGHADILHADIQEAEYDMLCGALPVFSKIDYMFISTHSNDLHVRCLKVLTDNNFRILGEVNVSETYSVDGIIVAQNSNLPQIKIEMIKKK